jgi:hypothetical protein
MSLPNPPSITKGQIALDPVNGIVYYKDDNEGLIATTWSWLRDDMAAVSTDDDVTITGNLTVSGTTVSVNVESVTIADNILILNSNVTGSPTENAGIEVERGTSTNVSIRWNESADKWQVTEDGTNYYDILSSNTASVVTLTGEQTLTNKTLTDPVITGVSPTVTLAGDLSGSVTLTNLGNATLNATVINNSVALGTDTTGEYVSRLAAGHGITITNNSGEGATPNISVTSTTVVSDTIPTGAQQGDIWYESDSGKTFVYYDSFWVEVSSPTNPQIGTSSFSQIATDLLPSSDNEYTLGNADYRWADIFLGPGTIHITDQVTDEDVTLSVSDGVLQIDGANQLNVGQIKFVNNNIESIFGSVDINLGTISDTGYFNIDRPLKVSNSSGQKSFEVLRNGRVQVIAPNIPANDPGALLITASTTSAYEPVFGTGGLVHLVGGDAGNGSAARLTIDGYGSTANNGPFIVARRARGTVENPSVLLSGDRILRITGTGWATTNYNAATPNSGPSIEMTASENFTSTAFGANIQFYIVPNGTTSRILGAEITSDGLHVPTSGKGIRFPDNSFQTTAYVGSNPLGHWGAFSDTSNQLINNAGTAFPVKLNTTDGSNGVSVQNDLSGNKTRITVANAGVYNIQFSLQLDKTDGNDDLVNIWLSKDGTNVPNSNTQVTVLGNGGKMVAAWNLVLQLTAGQYVQLMCQSPDTHMRIIGSGEQTSPNRPAVPSAILTVTQVA